MENIINNEELFGKSALDELTNENLPALIEDDPEKRLRSFLSSPFISASLPLKDVNKNIFKRKYNNISLSLASTADKVPFGKYGRLLLIILTTHAVVEKPSADDGSVMVQYNSIRHLLKEFEL